MKKYWIDFSGYVCVKAENVKDAERKFWEQFAGDVAEPFSDDVWDIDDIEEKDDSHLLGTVYTAQDIEDFWYER